MEKANLLIAYAATVVLVAISLLVAEPGSTYRWSFLFLVPLIWAVYFLRGRLALSPWHFALFVVAILVHDLGTFGFYRKTFLGLRFDTYVHFIFGLVAGLVLFRAAREGLLLSVRMLLIAVPIFVLGIGAIHEMFECFTTILLGPERGMLKLHPDQPFDTQKDLLNNSLGAVTAILISLRRGKQPRPTRDPRPQRHAAAASTPAPP